MSTIESALFPDPQACKPLGNCPECGGCIYPPSGHCIRCERDKP